MLSDEQQAWVAGLTVAKLKTELKARDLPTAGLKAELAARLRDALAAQTSDQGDAGKESSEPPDQVEPSGADASAKLEQKEVVEQQDAPVASDQQDTPITDKTTAGQPNGAEQNAVEQTAGPVAAAAPASPQQAGKMEVDAAVPIGSDAAEPSPKVEQKEQRHTAVDQKMQQQQQPEQQHAAVDQEEVDYGVDSEDQHAAADEEAARQDGAAAAAAAAAEPEGRSEGAAQPEVPQQSAAARQADEGQAGSRSSDDGGKKGKRAPILFQPKAKQAAPAAAADEPAPAVQEKKSDKSEATPAVAASERATLAKQPSGTVAARTPSGALPARASAAAPALPPMPPPKGTVSQAFRVDNLVRPFTEANLRQVISETGTIVDMWMPSIKTHAYVILESEEQAATTCTALHGSNWPAGSPKRLAITYLSLEDAQDSIQQARDPRAGSGRATARVAARLSAAKVQAAAPMDVDSHAQAEQDQAKEVSASPPLLMSAEEGAEGGGAEAKPKAEEQAAEEQAHAEPASKPSAKVGLGAVAAAKAALSAAAGQGQKRARAGSHEPEEPSAKRGKASTQLQQQEEGNILEEAVLSLDTLFKKTAAKPHLYWLPLTDEQVEAKKSRLAREEEEERRFAAAQASGLPQRLPLAQRYPHLAGRGSGYMGRRR